MTDCLIFGTGRCGTSALTGSLALSGAFTGQRFIPPTPLMSLGYFEDARVNEWNKAILEQVCTYTGLLRAPVPKDVDVTTVTLPDEPAMRDLLTHHPFALKDPRFSFTYPVWKRLLTRPCICFVLFRNPIGFIESARRMRADWDVISNDPQSLEQEWRNTYQHILDIDDGTFVYVRYYDVINGSIMPTLERLVGYPVVRDFIRPSMAHLSQQDCPSALNGVYWELLSRTTLETDRMVRPAGLPPATPASGLNHVSASLLRSSLFGET